MPIDQPQVPNLVAHERARRPGLTMVEGWCTRYGDIRPLVAKSDPMMAILNSGDGATIEFSASPLPARAAGHCATLMLYTRGWIKEADPNTLPDRRVEPLPVVRESPDAAPPVDWQLEYNTRWVPQHVGHTSEPDQLP